MLRHKDFSIVDAENQVEIAVFTEFNNDTKCYEVSFMQAVDLESGYPVVVQDMIDYKELINDGLNKLNQGHTL